MPIPNPMEGHWKLLGGGGLKSQHSRSIKYLQLKWNFLGGEGSKAKHLLWGEYKYIFWVTKPYLETGLGYQCYTGLCLGPLRTQQSLNKWGLVKLNFAVHKNTGKFASLTKLARSTLFLLISSVNILLRSKTRKKKPEMGDFNVSKLLFLRVQILFVHLFALCYQIP